LHVAPAQHGWLTPPQGGGGGAAQRPLVQVSPDEHFGLLVQQMLPSPPQARQTPFELQASPELQVLPTQQI